MRRTRSLERSAPPLLAAALLCAGLAAQDPQAPAAPPAAEKAHPVFVDGQAQKVPEFSKASDWVKHFLWVEAPFDSDGDGHNDRLHVDVWRPKQTDTEGLKVPVVYETSPYFAGVAADTPNWDPKQEVGAPPPPRGAAPPIPYGKKAGMIAQSEVNEWLPRGFAVVHSSSPGTGFSDGCPTIGGDNESLAPKAVIDWLCGRAKGYTQREGGEEVKATWCTGKVGMTGTSYNGALPVAAATTGVEGLAAIIPISPPSSFYLYYRSNGLVRHPDGYMGEDIDVLYDFVNSGNPERREWCNEHVKEKDLHAHFDRQHGDFNDFWAGRDYMKNIDKMKAATLMSHGWNDWNVMPEQSVRIYAALKQRGVPCIAYFHQNGHGGPPPLELRNKWFTHFLYGVDNDVLTGPHSWIVREGDRPSKPTPYPDYPHPDAKPVEFHAAGNGNEVGDLVLEAKKGGKQKLVDDVNKHGPQLAAAATSENRLIFATPILTEPLHLSGTGHIALKLASSKPAANLSVWLVELPWSESRRITDNLITRAWADPQNHASLTKGEPLHPGKFVEMSFDLQPDDQVIPAGRRIGLMIFSSDWDFTLRPPAGTELTIDVDSVTLTLPIVGGKEALAKATAAK